MIIKHEKEYHFGYNPITLIDDKKASMDFGIVKLDQDGLFENAQSKERAILLIQGQAVIEFGLIKAEIRRDSFLDENPICIHLPRDAKVVIKAKIPSEFAYQAVYNNNQFTPRLYTQQDCVTEQFGKNVLGETSLRFVRTVIDDEIAPYSNLVIGEILNLPGRWSSYPPHHHVQPEIYYYRIVPEQGFGLSCEGQQAYVVQDRDVAVITSGLVHPQVAAPGYAMYYIWMIPHVPQRWKKDRVYLEKDQWMLNESAKIWPDK